MCVCSVLCASRMTFIESPIPTSLLGTNSPCIVGIDEAGRGPVLGPMVYAVCFCSVQQEQELSNMGFADSKQLTEMERDDLFEKINSANSWLGWSAKILYPQDISHGMLKRLKYNLNEQAHDTTISLIRRLLDKGVVLEKIFVDTVGTCESYQNKLSSYFPGIRFTVAKKADSLYPIVSAASICAKVNRDSILKNWEFPETIDFSRDFGSGYPGDPQTKLWLNNHRDYVFGYPSLIRFSWETCARIMDEHCAPVYWIEDALEAERKEKLRKKPKTSVNSASNAFFSSRNQSVEDSGFGVGWVKRLKLTASIKTAARFE